MSSSRKVEVYFQSRRVLARATGLIQAVFDGMWLAFLDRENLHQIDERVYADWRQYHSDDHNRSGLTNWEERAVRAHFGECKRLVLVGAGGGREVLALGRLGFEVDAFECHPDLVASANQLLAKEGVALTVRSLPRDTSPNGDKTYDGAIVGWGAYMLIAGAASRVAFLRGLRQRLPLGGPILVSFFVRPKNARRLGLAAGVANIFRRLRRQPSLEVGDGLLPNFAHFFTRVEIEAELDKAGFNLITYAEQPYGHAVARAR